jgi:hypothetical protein
MFSASISSLKCSQVSPVLRLNVALRRSSKPFCARYACLCLEQTEETAGIGRSIVVTACVSHGAFTEEHAKGGIRR